MDVDGPKGDADMESSSLKLKRSLETNETIETANSEPDQKKSRIDDDLVENGAKSEINNEKDNVSVPDVIEKKSAEQSDDITQSDSHDEGVKTADSAHQKDEDTNSKSKASSVSTSSSDFGVRKTEVDVGITEYLGSQTESFSAVIKQRYSDFIVNEIDENGTVVHLTKVTHEEEKEDGVQEDQKSADESLNVLSEADREAIQKIATEKDKEATHNILAPDDKSLRTKIHLAVKQTYSKLETSTTEDAEGRKVIKVTWRKGKSRNVIRDEWPQSKKSCRYIRFVLYKENKDTMDAIGLIAKNLKVRESMFQYAGSKDKRAKTSQEITAHRIHPKKLVNLNKVLWNMGLGNFRYVEQPLQLGQLSGNHFTIVLRNIQANVEVVDTALTSLKVTGFINYFGMQRFGTTAIPTHRIGRVLLKGDWEGAIDLILAPRNDIPVKDKFQKKWSETRDAAATLEVTPRYCGLERNILEALIKKAKPFNALERLPRNTRLLYIHSYQSLVWNKMASKRLAQLGHAVVPGDLVMDRQPWAPKGGDTPSSPPVLVTEDTVGNYAMKDVVLPLPGYDVIYPNNKVGDWYKDLLSADGLDINSMKRAQKDYSLSGAYRHLVVLPKDVSWTHHRYDDYTQALTLSDFDVIQGEKILDCGEAGTQRAVALRMSLPSSCYATMALREAMRIDTSSVYQTSLNEAS